MLRFRKIDLLSNLIAYLQYSLYLPLHISVEVNNFRHLVNAYMHGFLSMMRSRSLITSSNSFIGAHLKKDSLVRGINGSFFMVRRKSEDLQFVSPLSEAREFTFIKRYIRKYRHSLKKSSSILTTTVFVDVGAHIGKYAINIAKLVDKVIAIEPDPYNFTVLKMNIILNGFKNIIPVKMVVGSYNRKVPFVSRHAFTAHSHVVKDHLHNGNLKIAYLKCRPLDSLLSELGLLGGDNIYFVKIDVEGYEIEVLQGMKKTLENTKCLMIETTYKHLRDILKLLPKSFRLLYSFKYPTTLNLLLENPNLTV